MSSLILVDQSWLLHMYYDKYKSMKIVVDNKMYFGGSLLGFTNFISGVFQKYGPGTELIFCKDGKCLERKKLFPEYKLHRNEKPDVYAPLKEIIPVLSYLPNIKFAFHNDFEADDILAYLAFLEKDKFPKKEIIIYSGDQDMWQLIPYGFVVSTEIKNKKFIPVNPNRIFIKYEVLPEHLLRYRIIMGDRSDNIPPVAPRLNKDCVRLFVKEWYETKSFKIGLERFLDKEEEYLEVFKKRHLCGDLKIFRKNIIRDTVKKLNTSQKNVELNHKLMSLVKYKNLKQSSIDVKFIKVQPNLEFVDFYNLTAFKRFLVEFFGKI